MLDLDSFPHWTIDVSLSDFPDPLDAEVAAALLACSIHGGMPTAIQHCL
jgi:hypothetical protein